MLKKSLTVDLKETTEGGTSKYFLVDMYMWNAKCI
jgi:hypothetical protein